MRGMAGLLVLGVGYFVFASASKEKKGLKLLGQIIGTLMMVGALLSVMCAANLKMGGVCPFSKAPMCPISMKADHESVEP